MAQEENKIRTVEKKSQVEKLHKVDERLWSHGDWGGALGLQGVRFLWWGRLTLDDSTDCRHKEIHD